jgi:hypothetical protein
MSHHIDNMRGQVDYWHTLNHSIAYAIAAYCDACEARDRYQSAAYEEHDKATRAYERYAELKKNYRPKKTTS